MRLLPRRAPHWLKAVLPYLKTLRVRLIVGVLALFAVGCATVGFVTVLALQQFLIDRLDQQLIASDGRYPASLEHQSTDGDSRGESTLTFGARLVDGTVTSAEIVNGKSNDTVTLTSKDAAALAALPIDGAGHTLMLRSLQSIPDFFRATKGEYRLVAIAGADGDVLITGYPLYNVEETVEKLEAVEVAVFGAMVIITGLVGAIWVGWSLRPLQRVADTATRVAELPLASGEVALPDRVPVDDALTEVGQVGTAINRMLGHVEDALAHRQASEERLRNFAADASHELRTPVATIRGHAELALRSPDPMPDSVQHSLTRIQSESERMGELVDELLLLARLTAGRPLLQEPVDLTLLVLDAVSDAQVANPRHNWVLDLPAEPISTTGDHLRLRQVVTNLLTNAATHTPAGTTVTVEITSTDDYVHLTVADNGPGIPDGIRDTIFDRFVRAEHSRTAGSGSGLGLAIVQAVTNAHHGTVTVDSAPGRTVFQVTLPKS